VTIESSGASSDRVFDYFESVLNAHDTSQCAHFLADDYVDHDAPPGTATGPEPTQRFLRGFFDRVPDVRVEIKDIVADCLLVAVRAAWSGTTASGELYRQDGLVMIRLNDEGRFVERWSAYASAPWPD